MISNDDLIKNQPIVEAVLDKLLQEAQERFGYWSLLTPEEVKAWIGSRCVHWFAKK